MTIETALIAALVAVAALINYYLSERANVKRAGDLETARQERAMASETLAKSRAETLVAQSQAQTQQLAAVIEVNTRLTQHAGEQAAAAFAEANSVNNKIAALTALGNDQVTAMQEAQPNAPATNPP